MIDCTNYDFLKLIVILGNIITVIKIAVPVIIMVIGTIDLLKIVTAGTPDAVKDAVKTLVYRFLAGVVIFLLPSLVGAFMNLVSDYSSAKDTYKTCVANSKNLEFYKQLKAEKEAARIEEAKQKQLAAKELRKEIVAAAKARDAAKAEYKESTTTQGTIVGKKYDLSEDDINFLATAAFCENAHEDAVAPEASQMANRYELFGGGSGSLVDYVKSSTWWQCVNEGTDRGASEQAKSAVKDVLVLGNRVLPLYIDEQDCPNCAWTSDYPSKCTTGNGMCICSIVTNGATYTSHSDLINHSNYSQDNTKVKNGWGADYTYYSHACSASDCDIYGYTQESLNKYNSMNGS